MFNLNYFFTLFFKTMFILVVLSYTGIFNYINHYIYQHIFQSLPQKNTLHKNFTLIDASPLSIDKLCEVIEKIEVQKPKFLIADIFHHHSIDEKYLKALLEKYPKIIWIAANRYSPTQGLQTFANLRQNIKTFKEENKTLIFYPFKSLYKV